MICPFCSLDMEPIDLSGKMFCSNCGMTIYEAKGKPQEKGPAPQIVHEAEALPEIKDVHVEVTDSDFEGILDSSQPNPDKPAIEQTLPSASDTVTTEATTKGPETQQPQDIVLTPPPAAPKLTLTEEAKQIEIKPSFPPVPPAQPTVPVNTPSLAVPEAAAPIAPAPQPSVPATPAAPETVTDIEAEPAEIPQPPAAAAPKPSEPVKPTEEDILIQLADNLESLEAAKPAPEPATTAPAKAEPEPLPERPITEEKKEVVSVKDEPIEEIPAPKKPSKKEDFSEKVKKMDTLGASSILLDILDDEALEKKDEHELGTLTAASDLIDDITIPETRPNLTKAEPPVPESPKNNAAPAQSVKNVAVTKETAVSETSQAQMEVKPQEETKPKFFEPAEIEKELLASKKTTPVVPKPVTPATAVPAPAQESESKLPPISPSPKSELKNYFSTIFSKES